MITIVGLSLLAVLGNQSAYAQAIELPTVAQNISVPVPYFDTTFQISEFLTSFLVILTSEIGDKTFFVALLLASSYSKSIVFAGTFGALAIMTVLSVSLGRVFHYIDESKIINLGGLPVDDLLAVVLLFVFGIQTIQQAREDDSDGEERKEAEELISSFKDKQQQNVALFLSTFSLVFAAEWGDKSFLATIAISAAGSPIAVVAGAILGHGSASIIAILGGAILSKYVSDKTLRYVGGSTFLFFALLTLLDIKQKVST